MVEAAKEATKKQTDPSEKAVPLTAGKVYVDPNVAPPEPPKELTAEEKKAKAEVDAKEKEAQDKVAKINANLSKDNDPKRVSYQIRNGEIAYMWVNEVPTRILTVEEMEAVEGMKPPTSARDDEKVVIKNK